MKFGLGMTDTPFLPRSGDVGISGIGSGLSPGEMKAFFLGTLPYTNDKAGKWTNFVGTNYPGGPYAPPHNYDDKHVVVYINLNSSGGVPYSKSIKRIHIDANGYWDTESAASYPVVIYQGGVQVNFDYSENLDMAVSGLVKLSLYVDSGGIDHSAFSITVYFTDDTSVYAECDGSSIQTDPNYSQSTLEPPYFSPAGGGTVAPGQIVRFLHARRWVTFYYTTDGSTPTRSSAQATNYQLTLTRGAIVKAIARLDGATDSAPSGVTFVVAEPPPSPLLVENVTAGESADSPGALFDGNFDDQWSSGAVPSDESPVVVRFDLVNPGASVSKYRLSRAESAGQNLVNRALNSTVSASGGNWSYLQDGNLSNGWWSSGTPQYPSTGANGSEYAWAAFQMGPYYGANVAGGMTGPDTEAASSGVDMVLGDEWAAPDSNSELAWNAFTFDRGSWGTAATIEGTQWDGVWLRRKFSSAKTVRAYRLWWYPWDNRVNPKCWIFQGSNDGSSWTNLDNRSSVPYFGNLTKSPVYEISNSTAYTYYRLYVTKNGYVEYFQDHCHGPVSLMDLEMFELVDTDPACRLTRYAIASSEVVPTYWTIYGSNNGSDWTSLASVGPVAWNVDSTPSTQRQEFLLFNETGYKHYKFSFTGGYRQITASTSYTPLIREIELYDDPGVLHQQAGNLQDRPRRWVLQGSNNGSDWNTVHQVDPDANPHQVEVSVRFDVPAALGYYLNTPGGQIAGGQTATWSTVPGNMTLSIFPFGSTTYQISADHVIERWSAVPGSSGVAATLLEGIVGDSTTSWQVDERAVAWREFDLPTPVSYPYYRLKVVGPTTASNYVGLSEIEVFGVAMVDFESLCSSAFAGSVSLRCVRLSNSSQTNFLSQSAALRAVRLSNQSSATFGGQVDLNNDAPVTSAAAFEFENPTSTIRNARLSSVSGCNFGSSVTLNNDVPVQSSASAVFGGSSSLTNSRLASSGAVESGSSEEFGLAELFSLRVMAHENSIAWTDWKVTRGSVQTGFCTVQWTAAGGGLVFSRLDPGTLEWADFDTISTFRGGHYYDAAVYMGNITTNWEVAVFITDVTPSPESAPPTGHDIIPDPPP